MAQIKRHRLILSGFMFCCMLAARPASAYTSAELTGRDYLGSAAEYKTSGGSWQRLEKGVRFFDTDGQKIRQRFTFTADTPKLFLEQAYPLIERMTVEIKEHGSNKIQRQVTGQRTPFYLRPFAYRTLVVPLTVKPGNTYTVEVSFTAYWNVITSLRLRTPKQLHTGMQTKDPLLWMLYGILIIVAAYNLSIYFLGGGTIYLYYIACLVSLSVVLSTLDGSAAQFLWPWASEWNWYCLPVFIALAAASVTKFGRLYTNLHEKAPRLDRGFDAFLLAILLCTPPAFIEGWYQTTLLIQLSILTSMILYIIPVHAWLIVQKQSTGVFSFDIIFGVLLVGIILFIAKSMGWLPDNLITSSAFHFGTAFQALGISYILGQRLRTASSAKIDAEKKYKTLIEGSGDIIFTLNEDFQFQSINKAVGKELAWRPADFPGKKLTDFVVGYDAKPDPLLIDMTIEKLEGLRHPGASAELKLWLKTKFTAEAKEFQVALESHLSSGDNFFILGKATHVDEDRLVKYLYGERYTYQITNSLGNAELMSRRLTRNLVGRLDPGALGHLRMALREALLNAIEHGNLAVTFEEKSLALAEERYFDFIRERRGLPEYANRTVTIEYKLDIDRVAYRITDQGRGFDVAAKFGSAMNLANEQMLSHGRGLHIIRECFDLVRYSPTGNSLLLAKRLNSVNNGSSPEN